MIGEAWTVEDLTAVRAAIARGELSVSFKDRNVMYKSTAALLAAEARIVEYLTGRRRGTIRRIIPQR